jgi:hypothetical protein
MTGEPGIAGAPSVGGWLLWRRKHALPPGTPCVNCEAELQGPYCHICGQFAETFHRSVGHLLAESLESLFHFDGRFWQTLPKLAKSPGLLTREYLDGKRANQIPPLRLFLVVLLIVFFVGELNPGGTKPTPRAEPIQAGASSVQVTSGQDGPSVLDAQDQMDLNAAMATAKAGQLPAPSGKALARTSIKGRFGNWLNERIPRAVKNPELFWMTVANWGHRMAFLMLPFAALLLSLLFVFQRRFYVFDHLIFSMHSLSLQGLLASVIILGGALTPWAGLLALLAPVHLFIHMRGTYGTSAIGTVIRMALLFCGSLIGLGLLAAGLMWIGLMGMTR